MRLRASGARGSPLLRCQRYQSVVGMHNAHAKRRRYGRSEESGLTVRIGRPDRPVTDACVTEPGVGEQRVVGLEKPRVTAPVDVERPLRTHRLACRQIGMDIRSTKGIDRLLRIADEDERRSAVAEARGA